MNTFDNRRARLQRVISFGICALAITSSAEVVLVRKRRARPPASLRAALPLQFWRLTWAIMNFFRRWKAGRAGCSYCGAKACCSRARAGCSPEFGAEKVARQPAGPAIQSEEKTRSASASSKPARPRATEVEPRAKVIAHEKKREFKKLPIASGPPVDAGTEVEQSDRSAPSRLRERTPLERTPVLSAPRSAADGLSTPLPPGATVTTVTTTQRQANDGRLYTYEKKTTTYSSPAKPRFRLFHHHDEEEPPATILTPFVAPGR